MFTEKKALQSCSLFPCFWVVALLVAVALWAAALFVLTVDVALAEGSVILFPQRFFNLFFHTLLLFFLVFSFFLLLGLRCLLQL